jgi:hypothetical protein
MTIHENDGSEEDTTMTERLTDAEMLEQVAQEAAEHDLIEALQREKASLEQRAAVSERNAKEAPNAETAAMANRDLVTAQRRIGEVDEQLKLHGVEREGRTAAKQTRPKAGAETR